MVLNVVLLLVAAVPVPAADHMAPADYAPNEIIVKFRAAAADVIERHVGSEKQAQGLIVSRNLDELAARYRLKQIRPVFKDFKKHRQRLKALQAKDKNFLTKKEKHILRRLKHAPKGAKVPDLSRVYKIQLDLGPGQSLEEVVAAYTADPDVEYAEFNYIVSINLTPNDPLYPIQWPLHNTGQQYPPGSQGTADADIDAPEAWDLRAGSSHVVIAVIDTGVDYNHRDLQRNMWVNLAELNGAVGVDDDGNGYVDDVHGYDFRNGDANPIDDHGHGTHCAGTIAARGYNGLDITGVCWNAKIMGLKFLDSSGSGYTTDAVDAFYYAVENGADVTSNSWGGGDYLQAAQDAIDYAYSQGVVMVAASGNSNSDEPHFPAAYDHMISVAATDSRDRRAGFSNYGDWVDIAAPGVDVLSLRATGTSGPIDYDDYTTIASGTSMACPHVAGVAGLLISGYPHNWVNEIIAKLVGTADDISQVNPGYEGLLGSGRVNAHEALASGTLQGGFGGYITLDEDVYSCEDIISIEVLDADLVDEAVQPATVTSESGDTETVILVQEVNEPLRFTGAISTSGGPPTGEDGTLQVSHGVVVTVAYQDLNDGTGNPALAEAFAALDCQGPVISEVRVESVASGGAFITFETDEPATVWVRGSSTCGGPYPFVGQRDTLVSTHTVLLAGLAGETSYYFIVEARDALGNQSIDDNAGACYSFTTTRRPITIGLHVPDEYPTIQAGIDAAADGETVWVAVGIYTGSGNRDIDFRGKAITVRSEEGTYFTIIDCNAYSSDMHRAFNFVSGEGPDSVLEDLTIINGYGPEQGYFGNGYKDRLVGGAIYCGGSSPTITNCIFRNNRTVERGGAIYCDESSAVISNCVFEQWNRASHGGAIFTHEGSPLITDCYFTNNKALHHGGAIFCRQGSPKIRNCTITGNWTTMYKGGGINLAGAAATVENCLILNNTANTTGGGVYCTAHRTTAKIINCTIVGNQGLSGGGIGSNLGGPRDEVLITNCIFRDNAPGQIHVIRYVEGMVVTYSDIQGGYSGEGNIDADPCFVDANSGNYRLTEDSLCIDAGTNQAEGGLPVTDFEGTPRPLDGDEDGNNVADMGAYEYLEDTSPSRVIEVSAGQLDIYTLYGQGNPDDQILSIRNWGDGTLVWEIIEDCPWLGVDPNSGESTGEFDDVALSVDVNGMTSGDYSCVLTIWAAGAYNSPRTVQVNLHIWKQLLELGRHVRHIYRSRGDSCRRSNIGVTNTGIGSMPWQVTWDCPWLVVDPNTGELMSGEKDVAYLELDCNAMLPGEYECVLTFSAETAYNSPQTYQLYVHVAGPILSVSATEFEFMGGKESPVPADQILSISNVRDGTLKWEIGPPNDCNWLEVYPQSGQCTTGANDVTLSVDTNGLDYGSYACELTISDPNAGDSPQVIQVNLEVLGPVLGVQPTGFQFFAVEGEPSPPAQILSIRNTGYDMLNWQVSVPPDCNWLEVHPSSGESRGEFDNVVLSVAASGLGRGKHTCSLTISALEAANSPETVEVSLIVSDTIAVPTAQHPTIQAAIDAAEDWDVVIVADGLYTGQGNRDLDFSGKPIIVRSADGAANCIIDCQGTPAEPHRGFYFHSGEGPSSVLQGFTITNGYAPFGAGILNENSSPTISDCVFNDNSAAFGGGLYNEDCSATVVNCIFSNNTAFDGAGVDNEYGSPKLINCTFFGNTADFSGGAVLNYETSAMITNCIMWGGTPEEIFVDGGSTAVSYCDVQGGYVGEGNIDTDPCFMNVSAGDYHLMPDSPAIDAGDPGSDWINEPWPNGFRVNIGAYGNTSEATRGPADFDDLATLAAYWLTDEPLVDIAPEPDGDGIANFLDFTALADYWRWEQ